MPKLQSNLQFPSKFQGRIRIKQENTSLERDQEGDSL